MHIILSPIKAILFDLDNTLFDREAAIRRVAEEFYREHPSVSASATQEDVVEKLVEWDEDGYGDREKMRRRWLEVWPDIGKSPGELEGWYRSAMEDTVTPDTEISEFPADLNEQQVPWGIITNGRPSQHAKCRAAGLAKVATFVTVSGEVGYEKPDSRMYQDALRRLTIEEPADALMVGDHPAVDIDGAKRVGMRAAWVHRGGEYPEGLERPDYVIDGVAEVNDLIGL